jgi:hypothetical protein
MMRREKFYFFFSFPFDEPDDEDADEDFEADDPFELAFLVWPGAYGAAD